MKVRPQPSLVALAAGGALLLGAGFVIGSLFEERGEVPREELLVALSGDDPLADPALAEQEQTITELRAQVLRLEQRLAARGPARSEAKVETTEESEPELIHSFERHPIGRDMARGLADLREVLPEKYAELSLEELEMLTELDLRGADFTDADLAALASLTHLRHLGLRGSLVTDKSLALLGEQLESVDLRGTGVTGLGLSGLRTQNLERLHLTDTHVTGDDLYRLPYLPRLATLKLNFLELDDSAIELLGERPSLRHVELDQTGLTNYGLGRLMQLNPGITRVELRGTQVSEEGAKAIAEQYPNCEFVLDSGTLRFAN